MRKRKRKLKLNWGKLTGVTVAVSSLLGGLAMLPYELGKSSLIISPEYKERIALAGMGAAFILRSMKEIFGWPDFTQKKPRARKRKRTPKKETS